MRKGASPDWTLFAHIANRVVMNEKHSSKAKAVAPTTREDRLKAALKANMAKRKAQARARAADKNNKEKE